MSEQADESTGPAPNVLREYALIADGERGAVVGPRGDLVWLCAPRWDSPSVFSALIGGAGSYLVEPAVRHVWGGWYETGSLIWHGRWITYDGAVECRDALAFPGDPHRTVVLRQVRALDCAAPFRVGLEPRADYDRIPMSELNHAHGVWTARVGPLYLRFSCGTGARSAGGRRLELQFELAAGEHRDLVLEISDRPLPDDPPDPDAAWRATESGWERAVPTFDRALAATDCRHSYAVLRGMTGAAGGMVAAATTSLPERADAGRNYDYRYVWIRDQCYVGQALATDGPHPLVRDAIDFVSARLLEHGPDLAPAYRVTGEAIPSPRHLDLPGYPGGFDVVGNWVGRQFQLDAFGEALQLLAAGARLDLLDDDGWRAGRVAAEAIGKRWQEPDAGIWEIEPRAWTHSRLTAAAGLRALAAVAPPRGPTTDWLTLADRIVADTAAHATHPSGRWQRAPDDGGLDAALLFAGLRGSVPPEDPRNRATLAAYLRELTEDGFAYRFRHDERPLSDAEGSFLLCGFLVALSLQQQGNDVAARAWFERTRAACGPPQLFSEEYDVSQHQMRGNLPQAFVHALMLETAIRLGEEEPDAADSAT
jgi:GH15 family glucan-1,4-alpha-glucosidase